MSRIATVVVGAGHLGRIHTRLACSLESLDVIGVIDPDPAARGGWPAMRLARGVGHIDRARRHLHAAHDQTHQSRSRGAAQQFPDHSPPRAPLGLAGRRRRVKLSAEGRGTHPPGSVILTQFLRHILRFSARIEQSEHRGAAP